MDNININTYLVVVLLPISANIIRKLNCSLPVGKSFCKKKNFFKSKDEYLVIMIVITPSLARYNVHVTALRNNEQGRMKATNKYVCVCILGLSALVLQCVLCD